MSTYSQSEVWKYADLLDIETFKSHTLTDESPVLQENRETQMLTSNGVESLPPEILARIFVLCKTQRSVIIPPNLMSPPWTLGRVCSRWRQIIWSTPDVWNYLEIRNDPIHREVLAIPIAVHTIVSHSRGLISLTASVLTTASALNTILSFPSRFVHLNLRIDHIALCAILELPGDSFDHLEALDVLLRQHHLIPNFPIYNYTSLQTAPKLKSFSIRGFQFSTCPPHLLLLPWGQITKLQWSIKIPPSKIYSILAQCLSLIVCEIHIMSEISREAPTTGQIFVPNLQSFSLNFNGHGILDWNNFLHPFELPSLKDLRVYTYFSHLSHQALISLISRSSCVLEGLSLLDHSARGYEFGHQDNYDLLQGIPSLEVLETSFIIPAAIFDAISLGLLPRLRLIRCGVHPKGFHAFIDLMDHYMGIPSAAAPYRGVFSAIIGCYEALGIDEAFKRFRGASPKYAEDGRDIIANRTRL